MFSDLKYALRQFIKTPVFTAVVALSLAAGIGANTAIFGLLDDLVLRPLPVRDPGGLILFQWLPGLQGGRPLSGQEGQFGDNDIDLATGRRTQRPFSLRAFDAFRGQKDVLADVFAAAVVHQLNLNIDGLAETGASGRLVSGNYYQTLGVSGYRGRTLLPDDDQAGAAPVAVLSYSYWHRRFSDDPAIIGRTILVNRVSVTVIGVTPPRFIGTMLTENPADLTLPLVLAPQVRPDGAELAKPGCWWLNIMGRLKPGVPEEQARVILERSFQDSARAGISHPDDPPLLRLTPGGSGRTEADRRHNLGLLVPLVGMAGLVLLAACANAANLLVARGAGRRHEIAVRLALGASRGRVIRQLLSESVLLALGAAILGLLFSRWGLGLLSTMVSPYERSIFDHLTLDWRVLAFTVVAALLTGVGFGLAPALRATRLNLTAEFQGGARNLGRGARSRLGKTLLIAQVAFSIVLLIAAGLFVQTEHNLQAVDLGFNDTHLLLFSLDGASLGYSPARSARLHESVAKRVTGIPGVRSVSFAGWPLVSFYGGEDADIAVPGMPAPAGKPDQATWNQVGPDYFQTYEIPLLLGRGIGAADDASASKVAVINQALARKYFAGENPIGRVIDMQGNRTIVGVIRDIRETSLRARTLPTAFTPFAQSPRNEAHFVVRTAGEPQAMVGAIRTAVGEADPNLPLGNVRTGDEQMRWILEGERIYATLAASLGSLALCLVCVGLYGLMSYTVVRRTAEIGLRMALGARPGSVIWMILREMLVLVGTGIGLGIAAALGATRLISSQLYGLSASDAATYSVVSLLLAAVAVLACMLPARRAARIDPVIALRIE
ncbi:MAG: ABC transporter permease [Opitutaceae bacterium]|jgi:predicted permease